MLALGGVSHKAVLRARGLRASHAAFQHGAIHALPDGLLVADSYHVSRLNTNTGRLTTPMFEAVVLAILERIGKNGATEGSLGDANAARAADPMEP